METHWTTTILICFITLIDYWMLIVPAAEVQHVRLGSTVTLSCNVSYLYETTWLKQSPDLTPTVVLCASLKDGRPVQVFQLSPHFSVNLMNRSLALRITGIEKEDLGFYYCVANLNTRVIVGKGTKLCVPDSSQFQFHHWYCVALGSGLLIMMLTVCIIHWKTRQRRTEQEPGTPSSH